MNLLQFQEQVVCINLELFISQSKVFFLCHLSLSHFDGRYDLLSCPGKWSKIRYRICLEAKQVQVKEGRCFLKNHWQKKSLARFMKNVQWLRFQGIWSVVQRQSLRQDALKEVWIGRLNRKPTELHTSKANVWQCPYYWKIDYFDFKVFVQLNNLAFQIQSASTMHGSLFFWAHSVNLLHRTSILTSINLRKSISNGMKCILLMILVLALRAF